MRRTDDETSIPLRDNKEPGKLAPDIVFITATERLNEAMALGRNPYNAFRMWHGQLDAWALEDPIFLREARDHHRRMMEVRRRKGPIPFADYVASVYPLYFRLMRRMGLFDNLGAGARRAFDNEHDLGRN